MNHFRQSGFTLVEAIVVMVVTSILAGIMVLFIRQPVKNYVDAAGRAELSDVADLALRRISRDLRGALPNSIRVATINGVLLLEFIPTKTGGTYQSVEDAQSSGNALDFQGNSTSFTVVGNMPLAPYAIAAGDYLVVYNLGPGFLDADAYAGTAVSALPASTAPNRALVTGVSGNVVSFSNGGSYPNPFSVAVQSGRNANTSPTQRFAIVGQPVTYAWDSSAQTLTRYWNYGFNAAQAMPPSSARSALLADRVTGASFNYSQLANVHNALIGLSLTLVRPDTERTAAAVSAAEKATLIHQVHVDNTP